MRHKKDHSPPLLFVKNVRVVQFPCSFLLFVQDYCHLFPAPPFFSFRFLACGPRRKLVALRSPRFFFFIARQVFPCHWARPPFGPKGDRTRRETVPALSALAAAPPSRPPLFQAPGKLRFSLPKAGKDEGLRPPHPLPAALQRAVAFRESCVSGQLVRESPISARTRPCAQRRGRLRPSVRAPARLRLRVPQPL